MDAYPEPQIWWVLLDLWRADHVWYGGSTALTLFRFLQTLGAVLFGVVVTFGGPLNMHTGRPALNVLVARRRTPAAHMPH